MQRRLKEYRDALYLRWRRLLSISLSLCYPIMSALILIQLISPALSSAQSAEQSDAIGAKQRLAVLELENRAQLTTEEARYLTDFLRRTTSGLLKSKVIVMTRENVQVMLPPDKKLEDCQGECEVLGVHYIITGSIIKFGAVFRVTIKLHETKSGELMGSEVAGAKNLLALEEQIQVKGARLIRELLSSSDQGSKGEIKRKTLDSSSQEFSFTQGDLDV